MKALVTGASGFIGGYLVRELLRRGHVVTGVVRHASSARDLPEGVRAATADIATNDTLTDLFRGQEVVFHLAAVGGKNPGGWENHFRNGVQGTQNVVRAAVSAGVPRFVHLSSSVVYRPPLRGVIISENSPLEDRVEAWNHYLRQKLLQEQIVWQARDRMSVTLIRPPTVLGPGNPNLIPYLQAVKRSPLGMLARDGEMHFPVVIGEELVAATIQAGEREQAKGKAYNVASSRPMTKAQLFAAFARAGFVFDEGSRARRLIMSGLSLGVDAAESAAVLFGRKRSTFPRRVAVRAWEWYAERRAQADWVLDCSRARRDLAFEGAADSEECIRRTVEWHHQEATMAGRQHPDRTGAQGSSQRAVG